MHFKSSLQVKYKINKISEVTKDQLSDFYKKTYYPRYKSLTNNWHWWYRVGYNEFEPLIISIDNKVIGQAAYLPTELNVLGNKVPAIWFVDYAILPEFKGKGLGRKLDFPTANIEVDQKYKLIPKDGVYVVKSYRKNDIIYGMMNIGTNPTV